jgi:hypothetical protein
MSILLRISDLIVVPVDPPVNCLRNEIDALTCYFASRQSLTQGNGWSWLMFSQDDAA